MHVQPTMIPVRRPKVSATQGAKGMAAREPMFWMALMKCKTSELQQKQKSNILVQAESGSVGGSEERDPVGNSLETVWRYP